MIFTALPLSAVVNDIVYAPLETPLLAGGRARGNTVVDGLGMLLYQAQAGFEGWFGLKPEVSARVYGRTFWRRWINAPARAKHALTGPRLTIIGLTGSIAMGKSTAAEFLHGLGLPIFNADTEVHRLLGKAAEAALRARRCGGGSLKPWARTVSTGQNSALWCLRIPQALADLEAILHPMVHHARARFYRNRRAA